jgi:hypothetical protein
VRKLFVLAVAVLLHACAAGINYSPVNSNSYPPTPDVDVLYQAPGRQFDVLGQLEWTGTADKVADVLPSLIDFARKAGADALIVREVTWADEMHLNAIKGQTIKYTVGEAAKPAPVVEKPAPVVDVKPEQPKEQPAPKPEPQPEVRPIEQAEPVVQSQPVPQQEIQPATPAESQPEAAVQAQPDQPVDSQPAVQQEQAPEANTDAAPVSPYKEY